MQTGIKNLITKAVTRLEGIKFLGFQIFLVKVLKCHTVVISGKIQNLAYLRRAKTKVIEVI
jgi:hypothetical protein